MLPSFQVLREHLRLVIAGKAEQGHVVDGLEEELRGLPDSYDALWAFARRLAELPLRADWPYVEPDDLAAIWAECDPTRPLGAIGAVDLDDSARRVEAAFLGSVCGCVLGKPLEIQPTLAEIRRALESTGEWPLDDYISERVAPALPRPLHRSWPQSVRERLAFVPPDDINYTVLGMLLLEEHGAASPTTTSARPGCGTCR